MLKSTEHLFEVLDAPFKGGHDPLIWQGTDVLVQVILFSASFITKTSVIICTF